MPDLINFKQGEDKKIPLQLQKTVNGNVTPVPVGPLQSNIVTEIRAIATIGGNEVARFALNQATGYLPLEIDANDTATVNLLFDAQTTKDFPTGQMKIAVKPVFVDTEFPNGRHEEFGGFTVLVLKGEAAELL
jgi:hypothetical protein